MKHVAVDRRGMVRGLYRGLMYAARPIDAHPALRALIARPCPYPECLVTAPAASSSATSTSSSSSSTTSTRTLNDLYDEMLGGREAVCYAPPPPTTSSTTIPSIAALVRREFQSRSPRTDEEWEECLQLGFDALKDLSYIAGVGDQMHITAAADSRRRIDPRLWEGMTASPRWNLRSGRVLVAHPLTPNPVWRHAVVLILEYSPEQGALGLIINRPESLLKRSGTGTPPGYRSYIGGGQRGWYWLSRFRLPAAQITPRATGSIYYGCGNKGPKWEEDVERMREADRGAVRFFWGHERWAPHVLERQITQGMWFLADVSTDVLFPRYPLFSNKFSEERNAARRSHFWGRLLELMGGPYAPLAQLIPFGEGDLPVRSPCCGGNSFEYTIDDGSELADSDELLPDEQHSERE